MSEGSCTIRVAQINYSCDLYIIKNVVLFIYISSHINMHGARQMISTSKGVSSLGSNNRGLFPRNNRGLFLRNNRGFLLCHV
jgi:hypothetical protein